MGGVDLSGAERLIFCYFNQMEMLACMESTTLNSYWLQTSNDQNSIIIKARASSTSLEARVSLKARVPPNHPALRGGGAY
ncbi:hypothetical protein EJB05_56213 [Eragrostis curvula]|uniref:Uncharacterized protein n=1 Tax=Eragrostis curvula TaxID=38414 RepID=A0A5J9SIS9_9POAL|nr:hypothetical protein EJB05_56213 [Eragrostis curvula]